MTLLDVRAETEFCAAHARGTANIPLEELAMRVHELPPRGAPVEVTDCSAERAGRAAGVLETRGHPVRIIPFDRLDLTESGPSAVRLWQPNVFLVEALAHPSIAPADGRGLAVRDKIGSSYLPPSRGTPGEGWGGGVTSDTTPTLTLPRSTGGGKEVRSPILSRTRALDLACGSGRDAVYLAMRGYEVLAIDVLPDALEKARNLARRNNVRLTTRQQDLEADPSLASGSFELVTVFRYLHRPLFPALAEAVAPGGHIVYETFHERTRESGRPPRSGAHLLRDGELLRVFDGFEVLICRDGVERDGRYVSSLLARRR